MGVSNCGEGADADDSSCPISSSTRAIHAAGSGTTADENLIPPFKGGAGGCPRAVPSSRRKDTPCTLTAVPPLGDFQRGKEGEAFRGGCPGVAKGIRDNPGASRPP